MARVEPVEHRLKSGAVATIRNPRSEDATAIIALMRDVFEEGAYHLSTTADFKVTETEQKEMIEKSLADPGKLMLVAEVGGEIMAILEFDNDYRLRLRHHGTVWVSIGQAARDQDLGTALGIHGWAWAQRSELIEKVSMHVLATNERSLALCRKLGFVEEARLKGDVKLGPGSYADLVILSRQVDKAAQPEKA